MPITGASTPPSLSTRTASVCLPVFGAFGSHGSWAVCFDRPFFMLGGYSQTSFPPNRATNTSPIVEKCMNSPHPTSRMLGRRFFTPCALAFVCLAMRVPKSDMRSPGAPPPPSQPKISGASVSSLILTHITQPLYFWPSALLIFWRLVFPKLRLAFNCTCRVTEPELNTRSYPKASVLLRATSKKRLFSQAYEQRDPRKMYSTYSSRS